MAWRPGGTKRGRDYAQGLSGTRPRRGLRPPPPHLERRPRLYSVRDAAGILSVSEWKVYQLAYAGELKTVKLGRRRMVPSEALDAYMTGLEVAMILAVAIGGLALGACLAMVVHAYFR